VERNSKYVEGGARLNVARRAAVRGGHEGGAGTARGDRSLALGKRARARAEQIEKVPLARRKEETKML
jgi:hypothetical protein